MGKINLKRPPPPAKILHCSHTSKGVQRNFNFGRGVGWTVKIKIGCGV